mgnify:FL=1
MKTIKLTKNKVALVDDEDFERLNQYKWKAILSCSKWYAIRSFRVNGEQKTILMHREIMNAQAGVIIDHKFGDGLDNRKENLRPCTPQQNGFNTKYPRKRISKSGIRGVIWNSTVKKFQAVIGFNNKTVHLGYFTVLGDADQAYRVAEIKYFGEFAREETKQLYNN